MNLYFQKATLSALWKMEYDQLQKLGALVDLPFYGELPFYDHGPANSVNDHHVIGRFTPKCFTYMPS